MRQIAAAAFVAASMAACSAQPTLPAYGNPTTSIAPTALASPTTSVPASPPPSTTPIPPLAVVSEGDPVKASGFILQSEPGSGLVLCELRGMAPEGDPACPPVRVTLSGVDLSKIPGWHAGGFGITMLSAHVTVVGQWVGGSVRVESIVESTRPELFPDRPAPCAAPAGGWPEPGTGDEMEAASARLTSYVNRYPDLYSGYWPGELPSVNGQRRQALVVGTVGDVAAEQTRLNSVYLFGVCVVAAEFSATELKATARDVEQLSRGWMVDIDHAIDRVTVDLPVFDADAASALASIAPMVQIRPLVTARTP
jgi:hypothetical protein